MNRIIFHIDVNSAYLSWTALDRLRSGDPIDLRTIPSIIGGDQTTRHGIVLAKSIPAKAYGIHTAEPVASALKKCPTLVIAPPDHHRYSEYSRQLMLYLHTLTPDIEQVSVDECYLDFGPIAHYYPSPESAARQIADTIREDMGFTVNIGISNCKILAKMASDMEKPNKIHTLWPWEIQEKMWPLPVSDLHMVGRSSAARLHALGIHTIGQLAESDPAFLQSHFHSHGQTIWQYANGIDDRPVNSDERVAASVGHSTTLSDDCTDRETALQIIRELSDKVSARLRRYGQLARTIQIDIKYSNFQRVSRQAPLLSATDISSVIYQEAERLFNERWSGDPIRLLGVSASHLVNPGEPVQMSIFDLSMPSDGTPFHTGRKPADDSAPGKTQHSEEAGNISELPDPPTVTNTIESTELPDSSAMTAPSTSSPAADQEKIKRRRQKQQKLDQALDSIRGRYGSDSITRGRLPRQTKKSQKKDTDL